MAINSGDGSSPTDFATDLDSTDEDDDEDEEGGSETDDDLAFK